MAAVKRFLGFLVLVCLTVCSARADEPVNLPGLQPDGSVLLHNQWSIRPAGRQIPLDGNFPVNIALHPGGRFAAVMDCGYGPHEVVIVDYRAGTVTARAGITNAFYGVTFSADGKKLFCSGGGDEAVHCFEFHRGMLTNETIIPLRDPLLRAVPCGIAVNHSGAKLFAANVWGNCVSEVRLDRPAKITDYSVGKKPAHLSMAPIIPPSDWDTAAADKRFETGFYKSDTNDVFPYACCLDEKHHRLFSSLWGSSAVSVIDLSPHGRITNWPTEEHPCEMVLNRSGDTLYVANANRNTVSVIDTTTGLTVEKIWAAFHPGDLNGSTPVSVALSPDGKMLFVANANVNAIAVFDVSRRAHSRSLGFIPTGWYPTSVRVTPDGHQLLVANGKGDMPRPNPKGPSPGKKTPQYIAGLFKGTLSVINLPREDWSEPMAKWTAQVLANSPLRADAGVAHSPAPDNPVPSKVGDSSPIQYVIYIIKENRTYDQVLGDMPEGNGDPTLCLFPERVTPNIHTLARQFVLLDNFYADASISADGHEWSVGAYATDFLEKMWPMNYGHNKDGKFPYPAEGYFRIAAPAAGYLWDRAAQARVSYRSYGEFVELDADPAKPTKARVKTLEGHIDPLYRGFDLKYLDMDRLARFTEEYKRLDAANAMPRLQILRLPNDHTHGVTAGFRTPTAYVAENDFSLGKLVELVSHSRLWPQTAIFVVEDDAQNGSDHVDAHRTEALVISPYTKRGVTDSTQYSTCSMLRTMELILGLQPMSQFDAAAMPMFASFQAAPDMRPFVAKQENVSLTQKNMKTAWGAKLKMDFSREDAADDILLNEVVWKSVRGSNSPLPAPVHAAFIITPKLQGDDDD